MSDNLLSRTQSFINEKAATPKYLPQILIQCDSKEGETSSGVDGVEENWRERKGKKEKERKPEEKEVQRKRRRE